MILAPEELKKLEDKSDELRKIIKNKERQLTGVRNKLRKHREAKSVKFSSSLNLKDYKNFGDKEWEYMLYYWHDSTEHDYQLKSKFWMGLGLHTEGMNEWNVNTQKDNHGKVRQHLFGLHTVESLDAFVNIYPYIRKYLKTQNTPSVDSRNVDKHTAQVFPVKLYFNIHNWYWMHDGVIMEIDPVADKARLVAYNKHHENTRDWMTVEELIETIKTKKHGDYEDQDW